MLPRPTLEAFDAWLASRSLRLEAVVIGGSALALLGISHRQTRDVDILHPELSMAIVVAAREFAVHMRGLGVELDDEWLNNGPSELAALLPEAWQLRTRFAFEGKALILKAPDRVDLLKTKLFALCDRGTDLADCIALAPNEAELAEATPWLVHRDAHPEWPQHVHATLADLVRRLRHGL